VTAFAPSLTVSYALCSLAEIGEVMSRPLVGMEEEASQLERLCLACRAAVLDDDRDDTSRCVCVMNECAHGLGCVAAHAS
jgi:predicted membrane chloride channel (bestrophin family)